MSKKPASKRSPLANPIVLLPLLLAVVGLVVYGVKWWHRGAEVASERAQILADVDSELAKERPDNNLLSHLMAAMDKLPDHDSASDLRAAQARIELHRGRPERADELFGVIANSPSATPAEHRLGARIALLRAEGESTDEAIATGRLRQVIQFAEHAYSDSHDPADLLMVWQADKRLGDREAAKQVAERLQRDHKDTKEARLAQLVATWKPEDGQVPVDNCGIDFQVQPVEIDAMRVLAVLQAQDLRRALELAQTLLARAPGVLAARLAAAVVFHVAATSSAAASTERASWVSRRDVQLDWLLARAPADEPLRKKWEEWRRVQ